MGPKNLIPYYKGVRIWLLCLILILITLGLSYMIFHHKRNPSITISESRTIHVEFDSTLIPLIKKSKKKPVRVIEPPEINDSIVTSAVDSQIEENDNPSTEFSEAFSVPSIEKIISLPPEDEQLSPQKVYYSVEEMPRFNGNKYNSFRDWIATHVIYPEIALENGISGRVVMQFSIDANGNVCDVQIVKGIDPSLDKEAIRVISSSPKWTPGKIKGKAVKVQFNFPVYFELK